MKKLINKLDYLITPILIYLSIQGSQGAKNLLTAWTVFGFFMAIFVSLVIGILVLVSSGAKKQDAKTQEILEKFFIQTRKAKAMRWTDWLVVIYLAIFAWQGWWVLFAIDSVGYVILKFTALFIPDKKEV